MKFSGRSVCVASLSNYFPTTKTTFIDVVIITVSALDAGDGVGGKDTGGVALPVHVDEIGSRTVQHKVEQPEHLQRGLQILKFYR